MGFPKFLRIASLPRIEVVKFNDTISISKEVFDRPDNLLAEVLSQKLGFSYRFVAPRDKSFGIPKFDGNWTGMVGMIQRSEADVILGSLSITEERRNVIDFSIPYNIDRIFFVTNKLERSVNTIAFLEPFSLAVWLSILLCVLLLPIVHYTLFQRDQSLQYLILGKFFDILEVRFSRGEYILKTCWLLGEVFCRWCFTAVLLSFLTFPTLSGVRTIPELAVAVQKGRYQCTTTPDSFVIDALTKIGGQSATIGLNLRRSKTTFNYESVLNNKSSPIKPAYIGSEGFLFQLNHKYFVSDDSFFPLLISAGFKKDFCCKRKLDSVVNRIWASGVFMKILQSYRYKEMYRVLQGSSQEDKPRKDLPLSLADIRGLFIILEVGCTLSTIIFLFEVIFTKFHTRLFCFSLNNS